MKKIFSVLLVLGLLISLSNSANPSQAATLKLNKTKYQMYAGKTYKLKVKGTSKKQSGLRTKNQWQPLLLKEK